MLTIVGVAALLGYVVFVRRRVVINVFELDLRPRHMVALTAAEADRIRREGMPPGAADVFLPNKPVGDTPLRDLARTLTESLEKLNEAVERSKDAYGVHDPMTLDLTMRCYQIDTARRHVLEDADAADEPR